MRALLAFAALALAGCQQDPGAPAAEGVCWRADPAPPRFTALEHDVPDLVSCAMDLDLAYLGEGHALVGAYQGSYIFVGADKIQSAQGLTLFRYPVFTPAQRAALDSQLRVVLAARAPLRKLTPQGGQP
jgi:hypothetical protein